MSTKAAQVAEKWTSVSPCSLAPSFHRDNTVMTVARTELETAMARRLAMKQKSAAGFRQPEDQTGGSGDSPGSGGAFGGVKAGRYQSNPFETIRNQLQPVTTSNGQ
jgi:hypothetical protein